MSERNDTFDTFESLLLDYHLGQLEPGQAAEVERTVARTPELAIQNKSIADLLSLLDRVPDPRPPANLADRILNRIDEHTHPIPLRHTPTLAPATGQAVSARPSSLSFRDLLAVAACIVFFVGVAVPGFFKAQHLSQRQRCLDQLRGVTSAMNLYSQANMGFLPYANYVPNGSWLPAESDANYSAPNTRHVFQLVRQGYVPNVRVFVCPAARDGKPMIADDYRTFNDFADRRNNSYSFLFMNLPQGIRQEDLQSGPRRRMVLAADPNPHFAGSGGTSAGVTVNSANSTLHEGGAGQNAVYADLEASFFSNPEIGVDNDNIYRMGNRTTYDGTETPTSETDTFLPPP